MSNKTQPIAHAARDENGMWRAPHDLADHLASVAELAAGFAHEFGEDWAHLAGQWHDLGKYRQRFQHYIRQASGFEADAHPTPPPAHCWLATRSRKPAGCWPISSPATMPASTTGTVD